MDTQHALANNVRLLKSRASKHAIYGVLIAVAAIIIATMLVSYYEFGAVTVDGIIAVQTTNLALWLLDCMPFVFAFWGQYVSVLIAYEASALVVDQTQDMRAQAEAIGRQAMHEITHDSVTQLPNRVLLQDRLNQAVQVAKRDEKLIGFLLLDLNRFKEVNDSLGYLNGDKLLKQVAARLGGVAGETDTVARTGDDEFAVLISSINSVTDAVEIAQAIQVALRTPFVLDGLQVEVQAGMGITIFPTHGSDSEALIQRAEIAMYVAKTNKRGFVVYGPEHDTKAPHRLTLTTELRQAIESDDLDLFYQPKVDFRSGAVVGVEALARWNHPLQGSISPMEFIPLAERTGLIKPLTFWVLKTAINQAAVWKKSHNLDLSVSVNISAQDLGDAELIDLVAGMLAASQLSPEHLILEITETSIMLDSKRASQMLHRLAEMGVLIAIDDFGTGYSSLSHLSQLPVAELKIDKSFVMDMLRNAKHAMIVQATVNLGHDLGLKVVSEGTADADIYAELKELECDLAQGFLISKPVSADDFQHWIENLSNFAWDVQSSLHLRSETEWKPARAS